MEQTSNIILELKNAIATLTINRPEKLNSLDVPTIDRLCEVLEEVKKSSAKVAVLTGAGRIFCAGADAKEMFPRSAREWEYLVDHYLDPIRIISELPIPVIARINGDCIGGGLGIALSCDFRIAIKTARFCAPFVKIGLAGCDMSAGYFLPRTIGLTRATEMMMTGRYVSAEEAENWGLINGTVGDEKELDDKINNLAQFLAEGPPVALAFTKKAVRRSLDRTMEAEFDFEILAQVQCLQTEDHREGATAFFKEKRKPQFKGK